MYFCIRLAPTPCTSQKPESFLFSIHVKWKIKTDNTTILTIHLYGCGIWSCIMKRTSIYACRKEHSQKYIRIKQYISNCTAVFSGSSDQEWQRGHMTRKLNKKFRVKNMWQATWNVPQVGGLQSLGSQSKMVGRSGLDSCGTVARMLGAQ